MRLLESIDEQLKTRLLAMIDDAEVDELIYRPAVFNSGLEPFNETHYRMFCCVWNLEGLILFRPQVAILKNL